VKLEPTESAGGRGGEEQCQSERKEEKVMGKEKGGETGELSPRFFFFNLRITTPFTGEFASDFFISTNHCNNLKTATFIIQNCNF
jgi:hypothetical protein